MNNSRIAAAFAASLIIGAPAFAAAPDTEVVEFYNATTHHYFVTATASEARIVDDGGAGPDWLRTGRSFQAWLDKSTAPADAQPVCRFYSTGANSHFYTASADECAGLRAQEAVERAATAGVRGWQYEGIAFFVQVPQGQSCPAGTVQLTRVYNNGFATGEGSNHRFLDDPALHDVMLDDHWVHEGPVFCAAAMPTGTEASLLATTTSFDALVGTWNGNAKLELEVAGGEVETHSALQLTIGSDGRVNGSVDGCQVSGSVASGDGFRSLFTGSVSLTSCSDARFNGANERLRLQRFGTNVMMAQLRKEDVSGETTISASLANDAAATPPASGTAGFAAAVGDWAGIVGFDAETASVKVEGNKPLSLSVSSAGGVTGTGFGCTFSGTLAPATKADPAFTGNVTASGCDNAVFNGAFSDVRITAGGGRLEVRLKREAAGSEIEIEGTLQAAGSNTPAPPVVPPPVVAATLVGTFQGTLSFTVGNASGSDSARLTIGSNGAISGSGFGCSFGGSVSLNAAGTAITGGSVTTSGCTTSALNGSFSQVQLQGQDGNALEVELEREVNGVKARIRGTLQRAS